MSLNKNKPMSLKIEIDQTFDKLEKLLERRQKLIDVMSILSVGDTVFEDGSYGDMFPQVVMEIDFENLKILTHEVGINEIKWRYSFTIFNEETREYEYIY